MAPNISDKPEPVYQAEVETLHEMLDRERETLPALEQAYAEGKRIASVSWAIVQVKRRIEALQTAIEVMGGAL